MQGTITPAHLAQTLGLRFASDLPPKPRPRDQAEGQASPVTPGHAEDQPAPRGLEHVDETPRRARRTAVEQRAEEALGHHWVTILSIDAPGYRKPGDNRGFLPVWVESNADWRQSGLAFDRQQPAARAVRLMVVGVPSAAHAARLKDALDTALHGNEQRLEAENLRNRFRNAIDFGDPENWLTTLLVDALLECELGATDFRMFTREEHERMVAAAVARRG